MAILCDDKYKSYIMAILASAQFSEDGDKVPVTLSDYIYDPTLGKFQNEINKEISNPKTVTVFIFKSTAAESDPNVAPDKPVGGSWDMDTDILTYPDGWKPSDELDSPVWMSYGIFGIREGVSTLIQDWSTPIKASGEDGMGYTFIYKTNTSEDSPSFDVNWTLEQAINEHNWTQSPTGISSTNITEWTAVKKDGDTAWTGPVLWSKWGVNGKDGDGVEYIYCLSETEAAPSINDASDLTSEELATLKQEKEYIPTGSTGSVKTINKETEETEYYKWTDSPSGVTEEIKCEYVAIRKFNHETQIWGEFESPKLWAKYGETGPSGKSVWIAYNDSEEKPVNKPLDGTMDLENGWYFSTDAKSDSNPYWWCQKISQTADGGVWGPILKLNGKDGTSISIKGSVNSEGELCSITNSEIGDSYLIGENLYVRVDSEATVNCDGTYWKNVGVIKGPQGTSQYIHIRYATLECEEQTDGTQICNYVFTAPDGTTPGRYLGSYVSNYQSYDPDTGAGDKNITDPDAYSWYDTKGEPGVPGASSEYYSLSANVSVVTIGDDGKINPTHVIPYLKHVSDTNETTLLTAVPDGYILQSAKNIESELDGEPEWITYTDSDLDTKDGITVGYNDTSISFKLLRDSNEDGENEDVDMITIPVVSNLKNPLVFDLTNQMTSIACDSEGKSLIADISVSTNFKLFYGTEDVTSGAAITATSNCTTVISGNTLTVSDLPDGKDTIEVILTANYTTKDITDTEITFTREATFVINKLIGAKAVYEIYPSTSVIKKGSTTPFTCKLKKTNSSTSELIDIVDGKWDNNENIVLQYIIDGTGQLTTYASALDVSDCDSSVELQLLLDNKVIDIESIPVVFDGTDGNTPTAYFQSFVFCRNNSKPDAPTGGSYDNPKPSENTWYDSVPSGAGVVWMSQYTFDSDTDYSTSVTWSDPVDLSDTTKMETIYSAGFIEGENSAQYKTIPAGFKRSTSNPLEIDSAWLSEANNAYWYDEPNQVYQYIDGVQSLAEPIWMAQNTYEAGSWQGWKITKIKGEDGNDGTSINIVGKVTTESELPESANFSDTYLVEDTGHLWVWDGDSWIDCGVFQGEPGESVYLHIKYANESTTTSTSESNDCFYVESLKKYLTLTEGTVRGEEPGYYIGIFHDKVEDDPLHGDARFSYYKWSKWEGEDGFGYEYIYQVNANTTAPDVTGLELDQTDDFVPTGWTDGPNDVSENNPYRWKAYRQKKAGKWSEWKGTASSSYKKAILDGVYGVEGYNVVYSDQNVGIECDFNGNPVSSDYIVVNVMAMRGTNFATVYGISDNDDTTDDGLTFSDSAETCTYNGKEVSCATITIDPKQVGASTNVHATLYLDENKTKFVPCSITINKVQPGEPAQNPVYIQSNKSQILYECGIKPESGERYLKSPKDEITLTFSLYEGQNQKPFSTKDTTLLVELESLSEKEIPNVTSSLSNDTLTVTIPKLVDENLASYGDFKIIVSDTYNGKDVSNEVRVDFYVQEGVITKQLVAFTKTNDDISGWALKGQTSAGTYTLPNIEYDGSDTAYIGNEYIWYSNTNIEGSETLWKTEGLAEIRKTSTTETYEVTWCNPYRLTDNANREIIYTPNRDKKDIPSFDGDGPTETWFEACNTAGWYDDIVYPDNTTIDDVDVSGKSFEAMWMATNDKKSGQDWSYDNWVFNKLYNENIQYKIITSLPSQPAPGDISFTVEAVKTIDGVEDASFTSDNYTIEVTIGSSPLTASGITYETTCIEGQVITIKLFVNGSLQEIYTATVTIGEQGPEGAPNYSIEATPDTIYVNVDNDSTYTLEAVSETITIKVLKGGVDDSSNWDIIAKTDSGEQLSDSGTVQLSIKQGTTSANWIHYIDVTANYYPMSLSKRINIVYNSKGDPGDDGNDGENARYLYIDKPVITVITNEYEEAVKTATYTSLVTLFDGSNPIEMTDSAYTCDVQPIGALSDSSVSWASYRKALSNSESNKGKLIISVTYTKGIGMTDPLTTLNITITESATGIVTKGTISIVYVQQGTRGEDGPMGETGPMMYPAGTWKAGNGVTYKVINNTVPYVYYPDGKTQDTDPDYFVLRVNETTINTGVTDSGTNPRSDTTNWQPVSQFEAVWTKVLMANFANIASAVFWGNYMFSEQGVTEDGTQDTLQGDNYSTYAELMFDTNGNLTGILKPNIILDFKKGDAKFNKLSTPFTQISYDCYDFQVSEDNSYNLSIQDNLQTYTIITTAPGISYDIPIIYMPEFNDVFDGTNFKIVVQPSFYYQQNQHSFEWDNSSTYKNVMQYVKVICADPRIQNPNNYHEIETSEGVTNYYYNPNGYDSIEDNDVIEKLSADETVPAQGFFIINGMKTKFLFLLPGSTVQLTSCKYVLKDGTSVVYWYVQNENLAQIPVKIQIYQDFDETNSGETYLWAMLNNHYGVYGYHSNTSRNAFGSKQLRDLLNTYMSSNNVSFMSNPANFRLMLKKTLDDETQQYYYTSELFNTDIRDYSINS